MSGRLSPPHHLPRHAGLDPASICLSHGCARSHWIAGQARNDGLLSGRLTSPHLFTSPLHLTPRHAGLDPASI
ncbi:MAG: hypothetical protein Q9M13_02360, partial [Mariprofundales bacterium]|nr:hypothetical protein [Mariprofundales bacterium]